MTPYSGAALVEREVWELEGPMHWGSREGAVDPADTGWVFGSSPEPRAWLIVSVDELLTRDPTLRLLIGRPIGTRLWRESAAHNWRETAARPWSASADADHMRVQ